MLLVLRIMTSYYYTINRQVDLVLLPLPMYYEGMTDKDIAAMQEVVRDELKPVHGELARATRELGSLKVEIIKLASQVNKLERELTRVDSNIETLTETTNALVVDVHDLQQQVGAIWDKITIESEKAQAQLDEVREYVGLGVT